MSNWLRFVCSLFFLSLLWINLHPLKNDKKGLFAVGTIVEKNSEKCMLTPCNCNDNTNHMSIVSTKQNVRMDQSITTTNEHPSSVSESTTDNAPITHFLKDFGKYSTNRNHFYWIISRI